MAKSFQTSSENLSKTQLRKLEFGLNRSTQKFEGEQRATVACILRKQGFSGEKGLEVFFILRATRTTRTGAPSRWSGQVGFPGGHAEADESDEDAVIRECEEEVGLHLGSSAHYRFIGEVNQRVVTRPKGKLVVCCRVYEQIVREEQKHIEVTEVSACGWCPLQALCVNEFLFPLTWSLDNGETLSGFAAVQLPIKLSIYDESLPRDELPEKFKLWGLTLSIINDILVDCKLRKDPITADLIKTIQSKTSRV